MGYTNSGLVAYKNLSPNHSGQRTHSIDRITPHCVVGQCSAEGLGDWFAKSSTQASSNYGIDKDGRVGLYVEEKNRSWCSSSNANDQRAVTIECASDTTEPYAFRDVVYKKLITLCVDICRRNGKKKLLWLGGKGSTAADKAACENYTPKSDEMILTAHRYWAQKSCPGNWMYARMGDLATKVTAQLGGSSSSGGSTSTSAASDGTNTKFPAVPFLVTVIIDDLNIRTSGSMSGKVVGQTGKGVFTIVEVKNGWGKLKSGAGWIYLENASYCTIGKSVSSGKESPQQGGEPEAEEKEEVKEVKVTGLQATALKDLSEADVIKKVGLLFTADQKKSGILASVSLAQFILESGYGKSELAQNANNCFGMKKSLSGNTWSGSTWDGKSIYTKKTGEQNPDGSYVTITADFRKYPCVEDSIADHSAYLLGAMNGSKQRYADLKGCMDYKKAAQIIKDGGYATSLTYVDKLCDIISRWDLTQYDVKVEATTPATTVPEEKVTLSATHAKYINSTGTHYISNSGHDENNAYRGGQAGDQTGTEWQMRSWYNRPWTVVLRYPDQKVALKIAQLGIDAALNDKIGYDQGQNRTYLNQLKAVGWEPSRITVPCEADCSAGVCANVTAVGYLLGIPALQTHTGTYTGNMKNALVKAGFKALTDSKYLTSGDYLLPGDILLNENHHTATNVTIGSKVKNDWKPTASTPTTPTDPVAPTKYYRVRKSWEDKASQIGAFTVLENAILAVDANPGYAAFNDDGTQVYPEKKATSFTKYPLTDTQLLHIARLCKQEQGTVAGAKAEASLMANQLETSVSRRKKYGTGADGLYNWVRNGDWFSRAAHWMDNGSVSDAILAGVKDVLVNGNRTLPLYVDEHDCFSDIKSISTGSVKERSAYVQGKTVVKNKYGSTWTFWCFPDSTSDPFGYTAAAYKATSGEKEPEKTTEKATEFPYLVRISISDLNYRKGPSTSYETYGYIEPGVYTIVDEKDGWGLLKAYADKRNGWISLKYATRI